MNTIFYYFIFPGILFSFVVGGIASYVERKLTARLQWRVGPPILQPFYDIRKLTIKEIVIPQNANLTTFILSPIFALVCAGVAATIIGLHQFGLGAGFNGDVIVIVYLLTIPSLSVVIGGAASGNPLASVGAAREMKLLLSYEVVLWTSVIVVFLKTGSLKLQGIYAYQLSHKPVLSSVSGIIAFLLAIIVMQAKLAKVPFDLAEAETEIAGGAFIEYSGWLLAFYKITHYILLFILPVFLLQLFWVKANIWKYLILLLIIVLIENTNPRFRITQTLRIFWFLLFPLGLLAVILTLLGY